MYERGIYYPMKYGMNKYLPLSVGSKINLHMMGGRETFVTMMCKRKIDSWMKIYP